MNSEEKIIKLLESMDNRIGAIEKSRISDSEQIDRIAAQVGKLTTDMQKGFSQVDERFNQVEAKLDQKADKTDIVRLENEIKPKLLKCCS